MYTKTIKVKKVFLERPVINSLSTKKVFPNSNRTYSLRKRGFYAKSVQIKILYILGPKDGKRNGGLVGGVGGAGTESRTKGRGEGGVLEIRRRPRKKKRLPGAESGAKIPQTKFCIHTYICIFFRQIKPRTRFY